MNKYLVLAATLFAVTAQADGSTQLQFGLDLKSLDRNLRDVLSVDLDGHNVLKKLYNTKIMSVTSNDGENVTNLYVRTNMKLYNAEERKTSDLTCQVRFELKDDKLLLQDSGCEL